MYIPCAKETGTRANAASRVSVNKPRIPCFRNTGSMVFYYKLRQLLPWLVEHYRLSVGLTLISRGTYTRGAERVMHVLLAERLRLQP